MFQSGSGRSVDPRIVAVSRAAVSGSLVVLLLAACGEDGAERAFETVPASALPDSGMVFPDAGWTFVEDPGELGWSETAMRAVEERALAAGSSAGMVVHRGVVLAAWGDVAEPENSQSLRKSLVSGLIGTLVADGRLSLDATLAELDVDDDPPLTAAEREATVRNLLHSRSGVYHSAVYEFPDAKERKPRRGTHPPGTRFFYNNWDFNVLETLAASASGTTLASAFEERIAAPIGMEDFRPSDVRVIDDGALSERFMGNDSDFPAHLFMISARDLARYGLLYLANGRWESRRILPEAWVRESVDGLPTDRDIAYGRLWWVDRDGTWFPGPSLGVPLFFGRGSRGHYLVVIPSLDLVVVNRVRTGGTGLVAQLRRRLFGSGRVSERDFGELLRTLLASHPDSPRHSEPPRGAPPRAAEPLGQLTPRRAAPGPSPPAPPGRRASG